MLRTNHCTKPNYTVASQCKNVHSFAQITLKWVGSFGFVWHQNYIESQNMLSWKGSIITESNSWPCRGQSKSPSLSLRALSKSFLSCQFCFCDHCLFQCPTTLYIYIYMSAFRDSDLKTRCEGSKSYGGKS